ncbi:Cna B domain protein [[Leptolyngbya] sp. PCC 7376]|uniref:SdrD B-like domain-containing protein n=1 Tax=[Leptolyngbya] sp. PCC 7376 TaxID=111781 RepID=UPI00029F0AD3|nr:SdrD B-like domain-containing protein [[Leptolyngbya] sp. PCC 7376]AFY38467.1 Cna B domain protein [[Leptolyngbya] sp. PCC 7376]
MSGTFDINSLASALPTSVNFNLGAGFATSDADSWFDVQIADEEQAGFLRGLILDGYCIDGDLEIDQDTDLSDGTIDSTVYTAKVYSSYDIAAMDAEDASGTDGEIDYIDNPDNLDSVNWLINQDFDPADFGSPSFDIFNFVQLAIWQLVDGRIPANRQAFYDLYQTEVDQMVNLALTNGEGFVPTEFGQKVAVVIVPDVDGEAPVVANAQTIIAAVEISRLGDRVWEDLDADGVQDVGEQGIEGATVNLLTDLDGDGVIEDNEIIDSTTTDENGNYHFDVIAGDYKVQFETPDGFDMSSPVDQGGDDASDSDAGVSGVTDTVSLAPGENNPTIDAGFFKTASLGDKVFVDRDRDGIQDAGEEGVEGVTVTLTGGGADGVIGTADDTTDTTTTDANGEYLFDGLNPGEEYKVTFDASTATNASDFDGFTDADQGGNDALDSDADPTTGMTQIVTLAPGEFNDTLDAGLVEKTASLGDKVFVDRDRDGIQDAGEEGVEGVTVTLTGGGADGVIGTADDTTDTTTTDANGEYLFDGLNPGEEYKVTFDASTATNASDFDGFTDADQGGNDALDSDADPTTGMTQIVTLAPGEFNDTLDAGLVEKTASLGDKVFVDRDRDGIQDAGEEGVEGVTVTLTGGGADGVIGTADDTTDTTTTDANGEYLFDGLNPGEEYKVTFDASTATNASDFDGFTDADQGGNDALDSDADPTTGMTQIVTLAPGEFNDTLDAGLVEKTASLGDKVFVDRDRDGIQDAGEEGVEGVTVTLTGGGADGVIGTADDTTDTTTTDANGEYLFDGLNPGEEYKVTFDASTATNASDFDGFTDADQGGNDALDSDADPTTGMTQIVTLAPGEFNDTLDAGLVEKTASLGDKVFVDRDRDGIQDAGEEGVEGVTVTLTGGGADGVIGTADDTTDTTTTDANGEYLFDGLNPGEEYKVTFDASTAVNADDFLGFTAANQGGDDALDSDADPTTGMTQVVTLAPGEFNPTLDAGLIEKDPGIDIEKFVNGEDADTAAEAVEIAAGADAVFTYDVTNTGNVAFAGADVVVTDDNGTAGDTSDDFNPDQILSGGFNVGDVNQNNFLDAGETWKYTKTIAAQDLSTGATVNNVIDFDNDGTGHALAAGTVIDTEYSDLGVTISATGGSDQAMIFDSANPTGGDGDLATATEGNILIISEDGDSSDPDDEAHGGELIFKFDSAVDINSISFVDIEESGGKVFAYDSNGNLIDTTNIPAPGDGSLQTLNIDNSGVSKIVVDLVGSGAISGLDFDSFEDGPGLYTNIGKVTVNGLEDDDPANYVNPEPQDPGISIEKFTNGIDVTDLSDLPEIAAGTAVTFTYLVDNTGDVAFAAADVVVTDDNGTAGDTSDDFTATYVSGDDNNNGFLDTDETWLYTSEVQVAQDLSVVTTSKDVTFDFTGSSTSTGSSYGNIRTFNKDGVVVDVSAFSRDTNGVWRDGFLGKYSHGLGVTNSDGDGSHAVENQGWLDVILFEFNQDVVVDKAFLDYVGHDSDITIWIGDRDGADISELSDSLLDSFTKENNNGGSSDRWANFNGDGISGDTLILTPSTKDPHDLDDLFKLKKLNVDVAGETTIGDYINTATVTAGDVSDSDDSGYTNPEFNPEPGIEIEKFTNGMDVDFNNLPEIAAGSDVTFTYQVTNTGNVSFAKNDVVVTDDNGTAGDTSDDFTADYVSGDVNSNNLLDAGETWLYTSETEAAQDLSVVTASNDVTFHLTGNSYTTGHVGNTRSYSSEGVDVDVSAFSYSNHYGWEDAYLGAYGGGLGVTNLDESGSGHRVSNNNNIDYVVFEFDQSVVVDEAYLAYVYGDSDISIWIGDRNGDITYSNLASTLNSFGREDNWGGSSDRWADFNSAQESGDTVIISAKVGGSNDRFKLKKLNVDVAGETVIGDYINTATVTAGDVSDSDQSGYTNPEPTIDPIHYEVGDMHLCNYKEKHINGYDIIQLTSSHGYATQTFDGLTGTYDIIVGYFDENDGQTSASVSIDGHVEASWVWNQNLGSSYVSDHNQAQYVLNDVHLGTGDVIKLAADKDGGEFGRFDYVKVVASDTISAAEAGVQNDLIIV